MNKVSAVIIDDEISGRLTIRNILQEHCPEIKIVGESATVSNGIQVLQDEEPDLLFLDIQLRPGTGFDILNAVPRINFEVIFCTAYDEYALKAFEFAALHYLMKPINARKLIHAVHRFLGRESIGSQHPQLEVLRENLLGPHFGKIALPAKDGLVFIKVEEIIRCEAEGSYTRFYLTEKRKMLASKRLGHYEGMLQDDLFQRIHHSHLINLRYLSRYYKGRGGRVALEDGSEVPVSERMKKDLMQRLRAMQTDVGNP